ncbi:Microcephalin [Frankliniella fusca]|uniref:Microcephalin n=1 Tax=Frankliniella fusca TaxID=407009 RepID=A0AAE1H6X9_9NEOP|nr:Microcephalin [Frankliniella fusca]
MRNAQTPSTGARSKRRLMPIRQHEVDTSMFDDTTIDVKTLDRTDISCPYDDDDKSKTTLKRRRQGAQTQTHQRPVISLPKKSMSQNVNSASVSQKKNARGVFRRHILTPVNIRETSFNRRNRVEKRTMVCTRMHKKDSEFISEAIRILGGWKMEQNVSSQTTHVICGDDRRTVNLLLGIAQGCWILPYSWVQQSLQAGHWLDEEAFEMKTFPAIQKCRIARETFGGRCNIFNTGDSYYLSPKTRPPHAQLRKLLLLCGAKIVSTLRKATVCITSKAIEIEVEQPLPGTVSVTEQWVLDSISENMLLLKEKYVPSIP